MGKVNQKQWNQGQEVEWNLLTHKNDLKKLKLANQGRNKGFICKAMCTKQNKTGRHLAATLRRDRLHFGIGLSASNFKVFDIHVEDNKVLIVLHGIGNPAQI